MFEVTVLFEGYSRVEEGGRVMRANCTCTLVRGEGITAVVDTRKVFKMNYTYMFFFALPS